MASPENRRAYNERLAQELAADPQHDKHGTTTGYRAGCRCRGCTLVHATAARGRSQSARVPANV